MVEALWSKLFPFLSKAAEYTFGRYEPEDIMDALLSGELHLWVAAKGNELMGITVTRFWVYPRKKCLDMVFLAGDDGFSWKDEMLKMLQCWAYDNRCDVIEASGRLGLAKAFKDDGYRPLWQVFELPVGSSGLGGSNG
jgi:hypothetical protein